MSQPERRPAALAAVLARGRPAGLAADTEALAAIQTLLDDGQAAPAMLLLPLLERPAADTIDLVATIGQHDDPAVAAQAALLRLEADWPSAEDLPLLAGLLARGDDRARYRTYRALASRAGRAGNNWPPVSSLGATLVEALARLAAEYKTKGEIRAATVLGWSLNDLVFDDPVAITAWLDAWNSSQADAFVLEEILGRIRFITPEVCRVLTARLETAPPELAELLLT